MFARLGLFQRNVGAFSEPRYRHDQVLLSRYAWSCLSLSRDHHGRYEHDHENRKRSAKLHLLCPPLLVRIFAPWPTRIRDAIVGFEQKHGNFVTGSQLSLAA